MKVKQFLRALVVAFGVCGFVFVFQSLEGVRDEQTELVFGLADIAGSRSQSSCSSPFALDSLEELERSGDSSIHFAGCGGLL